MTDEAKLSKVLEAFFHGQAFNTEIVYYKKDGSWFLGRSASQPIKNENGNVTEFFGIIEDITAEIESEKKFRGVLEKIGDNVWEHDFKTGKTFFSNSSNDLLGYETNELTNNQELWWNSVYKDDLYILIDNDKKYKNGESDSHSLEYRIIGKDGNIKWVLDRGVVIEKDTRDKILRITGTHTDITERKNTENRLEDQRKFYEDILNNMPADIAVFSPTHEYLFVNPRGIKDNELRKWIIGKRDEDYCILRNKPFSIAQGRRDTFNKVISSKSPSEWEEKNVSSDGKEEFILRRWYPVIDNNGEVALVIGYGLDITDRKNLEIDLIKSREQAEQLAKTKEVFLANMSHEIRTPMNAIMGMTNQLTKTTLSNQQHFYLDTIKSASENLLIIINDILDLSKIDAGKLSLENIGFEPKKVVDHAMQVFLHRAEEKGIKLTNSFCDNSLSPVLIGDPYRLNQVLLNLISNAIKFTDKGSVHITCEVINDKKSSQLVQVKIIDTGVGMDESYVEKLFDKFSQEYESTSRKLGGTGLGMSICRELIQLMGGEIEVSSKKGRGTTVIFRLTFKKGADADLPVNISANITPNFLKGKTILVTDDNIMNRLVASTVLNDYGATVIEATNGEEALLVLDNNKVDLILMDIQMPVMNGYEATKIIRKRGNTIQIIALTANAIKGENKKCFEVGMNDYISKPFKEEEFLKGIAKSLNTDFIEKEKVLLIEDDEKTIDSPLFDLSLLMEISRGDFSFIKKMINLFCELTPEIVREMKEA
ncbi:MAG: response regulator, partial [Ignavibacteria bacterium]|nr:response regulator [Ignavibacteria bacterium]